MFLGDLRYDIFQFPSGQNKENPYTHKHEMEIADVADEDHLDDDPSGDQEAFDDQKLGVVFPLHIEP